MTGVKFPRWLSGGVTLQFARVCYSVTFGWRGFVSLGMWITILRSELFDVRPVEIIYSLVEREGLTGKQIQIK